MNVHPSIRPVILSGGDGKRLWPVSRVMFPKQLQRFRGRYTLLQEQLIRTQSSAFSSPIIVANKEHRFIIDEQLSACGVKPEEIILEPENRETAVAIVLAALWMEQNDSDSLMLVLPSDHIIDRQDVLIDTVMRSAEIAQNGSLVLFGVSAETIQPELGYIQPVVTDSSMLKSGAKVSCFAERPDVETAEEMLARGALWNSGIYLMSPKTCIDTINQFNDTLVSQCRQALGNAEWDLGFCHVDKEAFLAIPVLSFDKLVLEQTENAVVFLLESGWHDLHIWSSVYEQASASDDNGNVTEGDVITQNCQKTFARADNGLITMIGLENIAVIETDDAILVTDLSKTGNVETLVDDIAKTGGNHHLHHTTIYRPWGSFRTLLETDEFKVKELMVKPGARLSLQKHEHRAEHWVVVEGTAEIRCDEEEILLQENQSTYIPQGSIHRLANPGRIPLCVIEVQSGSYLGEDDIKRFEDTYGRQ